MCRKSFWAASGPWLEEMDSTPLHVVQVLRGRESRDPSYQIVSRGGAVRRARVLTRCQLSRSLPPTRRALTTRNRQVTCLTSTGLYS